MSFDPGFAKCPRRGSMYLEKALPNRREPHSPETGSPYPFNRVEVSMSPAGGFRLGFPNPSGHIHYGMAQTWVKVYVITVF